MQTEIKHSCKYTLEEIIYPTNPQTLLDPDPLEQLQEIILNSK